MAASWPSGILEQTWPRIINYTSRMLTDVAFFYIKNFPDIVDKHISIYWRWGNMIKKWNFLKILKKWKSCKNAKITLKTAKFYTKTMFCNKKSLFKKFVKNYKLESFPQLHYQGSFHLFFVYCYIQIVDWQQKQLRKKNILVSHEQIKANLNPIWLLLAGGKV